MYKGKSMKSLKKYRLLPYQLILKMVQRRKHISSFISSDKQLRIEMYSFLLSVKKTVLTLAIYYQAQVIRYLLTILQQLEVVYLESINQVLIFQKMYQDYINLLMAVEIQFIFRMNYHLYKNKYLKIKKNRFIKLRKSLVNKFKIRSFQKDKRQKINKIQKIFILVMKQQKKVLLMKLEFTQQYQKSFTHIRQLNQQWIVNISKICKDSRHQKYISKQKTGQIKFDEYIIIIYKFNIMKKDDRATIQQKKNNLIKRIQDLENRSTKYNSNQSFALQATKSNHQKINIVMIEQLQIQKDNIISHLMEILQRQAQQIKNIYKQKNQLANEYEQLKNNFFQLENSYAHILKINQLNKKSSKSIIQKQDKVIKKNESRIFQKIVKKDGIYVFLKFANNQEFDECYPILKQKVRFIPIQQFQEIEKNMEKIQQQNLLENSKLNKGNQQKLQQQLTRLKFEFEKLKFQHIQCQQNLKKYKQNEKQSNKFINDLEEEKQLNQQKIRKFQEQNQNYKQIIQKLKAQISQIQADKITMISKIETENQRLLLQNKQLTNSNMSAVQPTSSKKNSRITMMIRR